MLSLLTLLAYAQDAVTLSVVKVGQVGTNIPSLTLNLHQDASSLIVDLTCGNKKFSHNAPARLGEEIKMPLDVPAGNYTCKGTLSGSFSDGTEGQMPLSFGISMYAPLKVSLDSGSLDLNARQLRVILDRKASKIEVIATTLGGDVVGSGEQLSSNGPGSPIAVSWDKRSDKEVIKIRIRAFDADGFWSELELLPWSYHIPHQDVNFATNAADITAAEEPKLEDALRKIQDTLSRYGADLVVINMYVGGYTDTVGDAASNQQLSLKRALAIAKWFKAHGFTGKIYYQGFGESGLAVETADGVDEPLNRRVDYVMASQAPGGGWTLLP